MSITDSVARRPACRRSGRPACSNRPRDGSIPTAGLEVVPGTTTVPRITQTFIQVDAFAAEAERLGLTEQDVAALEAEIAADPNGPPVVAGTGGMRKVRFAPPSWHTGKSGACRVAYFWFPTFATVYLLQIFQKKDLQNLTADDKRRAKAVGVRFLAHLQHLAAIPVKRLKR